MKTQDEIYRLQWNWKNDPCWDLEETEGFEDHRAELLKYRLDSEFQWAINRLRRLHLLASELGDPCNLVLAQKWENMEWTIKHHGH